MNDPTPNPPLSSTSQNQPQDTLLQRGAFDPPFNPGTLGRLNRFEIIRLLGEGGMGQVYLAREPLTDTHVAVKIMKPQLADDPQAVHRFLTEARHMYRLSHPRILRVLEVSDRKEGAYYVMPYIAGGNLIAQCKPGEPMPTERIATIARQVAEALAHAHAHGLIHRDIKPGNILLDKEGNAFLTDFGLVRTMFNDSMVDATASHLEGTASYMSPAVARGEAEDTRCDIYAFGAVLYQLLTGQPPYTGRTNQMILDQILRGPPLPIRQVNPKANPALAKIAEGCMARELRDRYASMADVVTDLARAAQGAASRDRQQSRLPKTLALLVGVTALVGLAVLGLSKLSGNKPAVEKTPGNIASASVLDDFMCTTNYRTITIDKYTGAGGAVTIPSTINGLPVTTIGNNAFESCDSLTSITIPNSITSIGGSAFIYCNGLTSVKIPDSVTSIGTWAFLECNGLISATVPASVTAMGQTPFRACASLTSILVDAESPAYSSADGVLYNKDKTVLLTYPAGKAGSFEIPGGVTTLGESAFRDCHKLTRITIPESVTTIDYKAFRRCSELTGLYFKGNAPTLNQDVFSEADKVTIYYRPGTTGWDKEFGGRPTAVWDDAEAAAEPPAPAETDPYQFACVASNGAVAIVRYTGEGGEVNIPAAISGLPVTGIQNEAFLNCANVTGVTIPNGITSIEGRTFEGCTRLAEVKMPNTVTSIGDMAFKNCASLTKVVIPNSVTNLGGWAFEGCTSLARIAIPASVPRVEWDKFYRCSGLVSILVDPLNPNYSSSADGVLFNKDKTRLLCYPSGRTGSYTIPASVTSIGDWSFRDCDNLTGITIPDSVTSIEGQAFWGCTNLSSVAIPARVNNVVPNAFSHCVRLNDIIVDAANPSFSSAAGVLFSKDKTKLVRYPSGKAGSYAIPTQVTSIAWASFEGTPGLTGVTIPSGVKRIEDCTFKNCTNLTSVTIPNSVTSIGREAFVHCASLSSVTIPDSVTIIGWDAFLGTGLTTLTIPDSVTELADSGAFADCTNLASVTIGNGVTKIGGWTFARCTKLESITIPDSVGSLGDNAFRDCSSLANATIGRSVKTIGPQAFQNCPSLSRVTIPDGVTTIGDWAFGWCTNLIAVTIPDSVISIGNAAFWRCYSLTNVAMGRSVKSIGEGTFEFCAKLFEITIPDSVTNIGCLAFRDCVNLRNVTIPNNVTNIDHWMFAGCSSLTNVTLGSGVTNIEDSAFLDCTSLTGVYFKGNVPGGAANGSIFVGANKATVYYLPGTTGWGAEFGGRPTAVWEGGATNAVSSGTEKRSSYTERRQQRTLERQQQAAQPAKPAYTQAELEEHLQKYQMEVILQGQPPLPVALTPESKAQLEKEGIVVPPFVQTTKTGTVARARPSAD